MKKTIEERKEYAKIIAQAWKDEEFKAKLLADPTTVLKGKRHRDPRRDDREGCGAEGERDPRADTPTAS